MRNTFIISLISATTFFAQSSPVVVSPDAFFNGEVLSVENLAKATNGLEGYKAMVKIKSVTLGGGDFSVSNTVPVYGYRSAGYSTENNTVHWTTSTDVDNQIHTNTIYFFSCRSHCNIKSEYGFSEETNGIIFLMAAGADH